MPRRKCRSMDREIEIAGIRSYKLNEEKLKSLDQVNVKTDKIAELTKEIHVILNEEMESKKLFESQLKEIRSCKTQLNKLNDEIVSLHSKINDLKLPSIAEAMEMVVETDKVEKRWSDIVKNKVDMLVKDKSSTKSCS